MEPESLQPARFREIVKRDATPEGYGTARHVERLRAEARAFMPPEFSKVLASHERAARSKNRLSQPHRLAQLILELDTTKVPDSPYTPVQELARFVKILRVWSDDPLFSSLKREMVNPKAFLHNIGMLTIAAGLQRSGNRPRLVATTGGSGRRADLQLMNADGRHIWVEVKTPGELQWPTREVDGGLARRVIDREWREARRGGGQLPSTSPGVLFLAAWGMSDQSIQAVRIAARDLLHKSRDAQGATKARPNTLGIGLCNSIVVHQHVQRPSRLLLNGVFEEILYSTYTPLHLQFNDSYEGPPIRGFDAGHGVVINRGRGRPDDWRDG
jgi:hypothetical protein